MTKKLLDASPCERGVGEYMMARGRLLFRGLVAGGVLAAAVAASAAPAYAAPGDTSGDTVDAHINVNSSITLSGLTANFTIAGLPGATVPAVGAVTYNVNTNNIGGYTVSVASESATLAPTTGGNPDSIPIANLGVKASGAGAYTAMNVSPLTLHTKTTRSAEAGDVLSDDYQIAIPFVAEDIYTATLDYLATAS